MAMLTIHDLTHALDHFAPAALQEGYDNSGLLTGQAHWRCTGALCSLVVI
jgi:putative NIF3 family GTP cyclohydrolase 1 type 2